MKPFFSFFLDRTIWKSHATISWIECALHMQLEYTPQVIMGYFYGQQILC